MIVSVTNGNGGTTGWLEILTAKHGFFVAGETRTREMAAYEGGPAAAEVKSAESIETQHATWFMDRGWQ